RPMPWRYMRLRGDRVLARCDASGAPTVVDGKVEIRYRPNDGKAYRAAARNPAPDADAGVLPDTHCGPGDVPDQKPKEKAKAKATASGPLPSAPTGREVLVYADGACSGNPGPAGL